MATALCGTPACSSAALNSVSSRPMRDWVTPTTLKTTRLVYLVERRAKARQRIGVAGLRAALRRADHDDLRAAPHGVDQLRLVRLLLDPGAAGRAFVLGEELE